MNLRNLHVALAILGVWGHEIGVEWRGLGETEQIVTRSALVATLFYQYFAGRT